MHDLTRRHFLKSAAMTGAAMGIPRGLRAQGAGDGGAAWRPKPALSSVMFPKLPLEDVCARAAQLGFKGIDLWSPFGACRHLAEASELGPAAWRKLLETHGLAVACYTTYRTKGHEEGFPGFAEFIGRCGGGTVVRESKYGRFEPSAIDEDMRVFFRELAPEIALARKHQVRLAIENHSSALLDTLDSIQAFTRHNPAPEVVGIALAPYHLQARRVPVPEAIRACGGQLLFFYAWQLGKETQQLPGHGPADFTPWLRTLAELNYPHWMTPFMHGELPAAEMAAAVAKARDHLTTIHTTP